MSRYLGFYLPRRFRRWFVYLPLDAALLLALFLAGVLVRAAFISADPLYPAQGVSVETNLQLKRLEAVVERSAAASRLDIFSGYSGLCGQSREWDYGFYVFYVMSLAELAATEPGRRGYAARQADLCTRLMLRLPPNADGEEIARILRGRGAGSGHLVTGYECLVLGIRRQLVGDTLYDGTIRVMADALEKNLRTQLKQCGGVWTSDQATQLHALWRCDQALGTDHAALYALWMETMRARFMDRETGLLCSQVGINPDRIDSPPRGTSVAWTIVFLGDLFPDFAAQQYAAFRKYRVRRFASLSAVAEFPRWRLLEFGDLDSGPMVLGISPAATGFGLCVHRLYGGRTDYARSYRIFELFGQPRTDASGKYYRLGNGMGDAILLYSKIARVRSLVLPGGTVIFCPL